jgi:hypothetical protein
MLSFMSALQGLFKEAFRLWREKSIEEQPRQGVVTYDQFRKLGKEVETLTAKLGYGELKVKVNVGVGRWAEVPWIGLRHPEVAKNYDEGIFLVYFFAADFDRLYLALIQGVTKASTFDLVESTRRLQKKNEIPENFTIGLQGKLTKNAYFNSDAEKYEKAVVYSKSYAPESIDDEAFVNDLKAALHAYLALAKKT